MYHSPNSTIRRRRVQAGLAAAVAVLTMAALPSLASALTLNSVALVSNASNSTLPLDVNGASTSPGAPVIQWFGNGGSNQRWNFVTQADGYEHIVNQNSGMCLTTDGVAGHWVYQWPCGSSWNQEWSSTVLNRAFTDAPGATIESYNRGLYLDVAGDAYWPGGHLITWYWNDTPGEFFAYLQL
jgi:Ricin-type beta-trefoil lectin domain-like